MAKVGAAKPTAPGKVFRNEFSTGGSRLGVVRRQVARQDAAPAAGAEDLGRRRSRAGGGVPSERIAQRQFLGFIEGRLQYDAAKVLDLCEDLVRGHLLDKHEQGCVARLDAFGELLHEFVINANVRQRAAERAARRPQGRAEQRIEEKHPDQQPPETAGNGAGRCRIDDLMQLDLPVGRFRGDDRIPELDQILLCNSKSRLRTSSAFSSDG